MGKYILGIDDGGSAVKAAIFGIDGTMIAAESGPAVPMNTPGPGQTERDMETLWQANVQAIRRALHAARVSSEDIAVVSATGHGNGLYLVDAEGKPTFGAIISTDERAELRVSEWTSDQRYRTDVLPRTAQSLWPGQPPALMDWIRHERPQVLERSRWALLASGFVRMRLTGEATANVSDISGTSLFDVNQRQYDERILEYYELGEFADLLPPVIDSVEPAGYVTDAAAEETGLRAGTPVAGGVFDIAASALASGLVERNKLAIVTGTWSINEFVSDRPIVDPELFMTSIYPIPDSWLVTEGSPTSAGVFEWYINKVLIPAMNLGAAYHGDNRKLYRTIDDLAFGKEAESSEIPCFLPYVFGTSRHPMTRGVLSGIVSEMGLPQVVRSIFEGIVYSHMDHIAALAQYTDLPNETVFTGGIANSEPWTQLFADCTQRVLEVVNVKEAGALGTAMAGAVLAGEYSNIAEAARQMSPGSRLVVPEAAKASRYAERYSAWQAALGREEGTYRVC